MPRRLSALPTKHVDIDGLLDRQGRHAWARIEELARGQHAAVAHWQLLDVGLTRGEVRGWRLRGALTPLFRGVYAVGPMPATDLTRWMAGTLAHHPSLLSHRRCCEHLGLIAPVRGPVHVLKPGTRPRSQPGLVVHRTTLPLDPYEHLGIPIVAPMLAVVQTAGSLGPTGIRRLLDRAEQLELLDVAAIDQILSRYSNVRNRARLLFELAAYRAANPETRSPLESLFMRECRRRQAEIPATNVPIGRDEVDFFWAASGLIVEIDGFDPHGGRIAFDRDRAKWARLTALGYPLIVVTEWRLRQDADALFAEIGTINSKACRR